MKLRNLLFGTMIACAFVSCSNDDDPTPDQGTTTAGTYLEVFAKSPISSKADPSNDGEIKSLTLVVFDAANTIEAIESSTTGKVATSRKVAVTPGVKSAMMIANYTLPNTIAVGDDYSELAALTNSRENEISTTGFSMSSKLYTGLTVEANKTTYLGYTGSAADDPAGIISTEDQEGVKLYRNVAKIVLSKVAITNEKGDFKNMSNPNLEIKEVFILNAKATTNLVAGADDKAKHWASTQSAATDLLGGVDKVDTWTNSDKFLLGASWDVQTFLKSSVAASTIGYFKGAAESVSTETAAYAAVPFYVYENGSAALATAEAKTLLVIKADVTYDGVNGRETASNRYYTLAIGRTGFDPNPDKTTNGFTIGGTPADFPFASRVDAGGINGADESKAFDVLRNLQYNISLTVKGLGYDQPGGGDPSQYLDVKVRVVPFGTVDQNVEI